MDQSGESGEGVSDSTDLEKIKKKATLKSLLESDYSLMLQELG